MENNPGKLDWLLKVAIILSILVVAISIFFYLVVYPLIKINGNEDQKVELQRNQNNNILSTTTEVVDVKSLSIQEVTTPVQIKSPSVVSNRVAQSPLVNNSNVNANYPLTISGIQAVPIVNNIDFKWNTSQPTTGYITIWPVSTESGNIRFYSTNLKTNHFVNAYSLNLLAGKTYSYSVTSKDENGQEVFSEEKKVTLPYDLVAPNISLTAPEKAMGVTFYFTAKTSEWASVKVEYFLTIEANMKTNYYTFEDDINYSIPVSFNIGYSDGSTLNIRLTATDKYGNKSYYGWIKYGFKGDYLVRK